jgi:hypothetical protein
MLRSGGKTNVEIFVSGSRLVLARRAFAQKVTNTRSSPIEAAIKVASIPAAYPALVRRGSKWLLVALCV